MKRHPPFALAAALALTTAMLLAPTTVPAATQIESAVAAYERGDLVAAREAFARLSQAGVSAADYNLAVMHLRRELPRPDAREALRLMTRAAEAGFVTAMFGLAQLYDNASVAPGGRADIVQANRWFQRAAEAGSVDAQGAIATAHFLGRGTAKNPTEAARWYREAAKGGDVGAQYLIASMYEAGDGVARDLRLARYWYDIAARNGDEAAPGKVKELDVKLAAPKS